MQCVSGTDQPPVIYQMQVHGILSPHSVVGCDRLCDLPVRVNGFPAQRAFGQIDKKRNGGMDHRRQPRHDQVFAAHADGRVKFHIFLRMVLTCFQKLFRLVAQFL